jgi:hypothetical protein
MFYISHTEKRFYSLLLLPSNIDFYTIVHRNNKHIIFEKVIDNPNILLNKDTYLLKLDKKMEVPKEIELIVTNLFEKKLTKILQNSYKESQKYKEKIKILKTIVNSNPLLKD